MEDFREKSSLDAPMEKKETLPELPHISGGNIQKSTFSNVVGGAMADTLITVASSMIREDIPTTLKDVAYKLGHSFLQRMCYGNKKKSSSSFVWDRTSYGSFFDPYEDDDWPSSGSNIRRPSQNKSTPIDARYDGRMPDVWFYSAPDADKAIRIMQNIITDPKGPGYLTVGNMYDMLNDPDNPETTYKTSPTQFEWGWTSLAAASVAYDSRRDRKKLPAYKLVFPQMRNIEQIKRERREI